MSCIPYVMISYSCDGGETWSHEIKKELINCTKNYRNRIIIGPIGSAYNLIFRIKCSENTSFTIVEGNARITFGI